MSLKDNYLKLAKKFGGPYTLESKGLRMSIITSIMRGSDIGISKAYEVAKVLGVSVGDLIAENPTTETVNEVHAEYQSAEERKYTDKLLSVLRGHDEAKKATVKGVLDMAKQDAWTQEERQAYKKRVV